MSTPLATEDTYSWSYASPLFAGEQESSSNDDGSGDGTTTHRPLDHNAAFAVALNDAEDPFADEDVPPLNGDFPSSGKGTEPAERYSLALSPSSGTPRILAILIPFLVLASHALFLYGQIAPMWLLRESREIDVWANATSTLAKTTFGALGLPYEKHYAISEAEDLDTVTFGFGIKQLWRAKGLPSKSSSRFAAVILVLFSGVWPHLKLVLMNLYWLLPTREKSRHNALYWLSSLGKWSLADVLVVCVIMCVLNLTWTIDTDAIKKGVVKEFPAVVKVVKEKYSYQDLCNKILKIDCKKSDVSLVDNIKCRACYTAVSEAYEHPELAEGTVRKMLDGVETGGGGHVSLRILGMHGIYSFCAAVVSSIVLSLLVDLFDRRARLRTAQARSARDKQRRSLEVDVNEPLLERARSHSSSQYTKQTKQGSYLTIIRNALVIVTACATVVIVIFAIRTPTMERVVTGAIPTVLHDMLGVDWESEFSLWKLMETTGEAGGPDTFLMTTFGLFVVFGPIVRACLCLISGLITPFMESTPRLLRITIDVLGAFTAWEVLTVAVFLVVLEMPPLTNTIVERPECKQISSDRSCLSVDVNVLNGYWLVVAGWALLVTLSFALVRMAQRQRDAS